LGTAPNKAFQFDADRVKRASVFSFRKEIRRWEG
jgi:hypothetical protein